MHTDANEIAGMLEDMFSRDMTDVVRLCQSCHRRHAVGMHLLFHGSGMVLRCPTCGHPAAAIVTVGDGYAVSMHGAWMMA
jgi:hypothetical protein